MPKALDLAGARFGRLVAKREDHRDERGVWWECACDCGGTSVLPAARLRGGHTKSCGECVRDDPPKPARLTRRALLSEREEMLAVLRSVEWKGADGGLGGVCPVCGGMPMSLGREGQAGWGHAPDCRLAALLRGSPSSPSGR